MIMVARWLGWLPGHLFAVAMLVGLALIGYCAWLRLGARIHSREQMFHMSTPFPLVGRLDLVMQEWGGTLVVHDLKTRKSAKIYPSDKLQLELYALLLRQATGRRVASHGYIRLQVAGKMELRKVELGSDAASLLRLYDSFMQKANDPASANMTAPPYMCAHCGFRGNECVGRKK